MAVVSISRIQVRRGTANQGTGLPQLASGEFGWAIDSQELYIGNGSTSEGAPAVGNTQVLTSNSNIINLAGQYTYRANSNIQTSESTQVVRSIAARLDERVSINSFGGLTQTDQLQKALLELYLTDPTPTSAPVLHIEPGVFNITRTVYVPPNTTIVGSGKNKTIFTKAGNFDMFRTIGTNVPYSGFLSSITETEVTALSTSGQTEDRAQNIRFEAMTLRATGQRMSGRSYLLRLDNCSNSEFKDIEFIYPAGEASVTNYESGVGLDSGSGATISRNNKFIDCDFTGLKEAAHSLLKADDNQFIRCNFNQLNRGVVLGESGLLAGNPGADNNIITDSKFSNINQQAFMVLHGTGNRSKNNRYGENVSNGFPVVKYGERGNFSIDDTFERTYNYAISGNLNEAYLPEVEGPVFYTNGGYHEFALSGTPVPFRLPADATRAYSIDYFYKSASTGLTQSGVLDVLVSPDTDLVDLANSYSEVNGSGPEVTEISFASELQLDLVTSEVLSARILVSSSQIGNIVVKITTKS
jgi:hypothetical protein